MSDLLPCLSLKHESGGSDVELPALSWQLALPWPKSFVQLGSVQQDYSADWPRMAGQGLAAPPPQHSSSSNRPGGF